MKSYLILALLLIWQSTALATGVSSTSAPPHSSSDDFKFNARVLATDVSTFGNPVNAAQKLLYELGKFSLIGEVVQAKFFEYDGSHRLLFEMSNALQAKSVFQAYIESEPKPTFRLSRTKDDFYDTQMEFRTG